MKTLGLFIVFASVFLIGLYFAQKQTAVLKSIKRTDYFIGKMILCIKNEHATVFEIFEFIKKDCDMSTEIFINNIKPDKLQEAGKIAEKCGFSQDKTVLAVLSDVFNVLGKYSAEEQIREMEFCRQKIRDYYEKNESDIRFKAKLAANSGILCGILVVILFL